MNSTQIVSTETLLKENESLKNENSYLKEQLEWFKRNLFGPRSEKVIPKNENQLEFDGFGNLQEKDEKNTQKITAHSRRSKNKGKDRITLPEDLPTETILVDLSENEKKCPETGADLVKIGEEITYKLAFKPGSYFLKKIIRPKYASQNNPDAGVNIAPLPESLLTRCFADDSFLADILVKKYADHLPLYRQSEILNRQGINISRQVMSGWIVRAGFALKPLYDLMTEQILASGNAFVDETPVKMLDPGKGKTHQAYAWILAGGRSKDPPYRVYHFYKDRKYVNAKELLKGFNGILHSDKYGAYEDLANAKQFTWCPCWSHIRRKFYEAESGDLEFRNWVLRKIKYLFWFEKIGWSKSADERMRIRQEKEIPIIDELINTIKNKLTDNKLLPKSKIRTAIGYFCSLIPHLKNYTKNAFARLDNNVAERAVRPLAIGRKNWLFVGNEDGGEATAIIYSLVQTCRGLGVNPWDYLSDIMTRLMSHPASKINELLPDQWALDKGLSIKQE